MNDTDDSQDWFWTDAWQAGEAEATAQIAAGKVTVYETLEAMFAALEAGPG